jgi:hypothetical protein
MGFKGTKGKWKLIEGNKDTFSKVKIGRRVLDLSTLGIPSTKYKEEIANAKLISCALELLTDLNDIVWLIERGATMEELEERIKTSKELIKKATEI